MGTNRPIRLEAGFQEDEERERRPGQRGPVIDQSGPRIWIDVEVAEFLAEPLSKGAAKARDLLPAPAEEFALLRVPEVLHPLDEGVGLLPLGRVGREILQDVEPILKERGHQWRWRWEPPREETEHQPGGFAVDRAVDRRQCLALAPPLLGRPEGIEARVRWHGHGHAPACKVLGRPVAKRAMRVHPGIENGAGEVLIVALDRLQHGLEELWPGRAAGVPVSVHPKTPQGGPEWSAKFLRLGTVLEGAPHDPAAEVLAHQGEDLAGSSRFGRGLGSHWGRSLQGMSLCPSTRREGCTDEGRGQPAAAPCVRPKLGAFHVPRQDRFCEESRSTPMMARCTQRRGGGIVPLAGGHQPWSAKHPRGSSAGRTPPSRQGLLVRSDPLTAGGEL